MLHLLANGPRLFGDSLRELISFLVEDVEIASNTDIGISCPSRPVIYLCMMF